MSKKTTAPTCATLTNPVSTSPTSAEAPAVEALRAAGSTARGLRADELASVLDALAQPVPAFLHSVPGPNGDELAPADELFNSNIWPDADGVETLVGRLRDFLCSAGSVSLFSLVNGGPELYFGAPRLSFRAGDTAAVAERAAELARRAGRSTPDAPDGFTRYECELTQRSFTLPLGAPVPTLLFDTPGGGLGGPLGLAGRSAPHPDEYVEAEDDAGLHGFTVHPALVEAGPAHVLRAAWLHVERKVVRHVDFLREACDLAAGLAGVEPEALGVEWPGRAYRQWNPVERPGKDRTWKRELAGVGTE